MVRPEVRLDLVQILCVACNWSHAKYWNNAFSAVNYRTLVTYTSIADVNDRNSSRYDGIEFLVCRDAEILVSLLFLPNMSLNLSKVTFKY